MEHNMKNAADLVNAYRGYLAALEKIGAYRGLVHTILSVFNEMEIYMQTGKLALGHPEYWGVPPDEIELTTHFAGKNLYQSVNVTYIDLTPEIIRHKTKMILGVIQSPDYSELYKEKNRLHKVKRTDG